MTITEQIAQGIAAKLSIDYKKEIFHKLSHDLDINNEIFWEEYKDTAIYVYCEVTGEEFISTSIFALEEAEALLLEKQFYLI